MLRKDFDIDVRLLGILGSKTMLLSDTPIDLSNWKEDFQKCALVPNLPSHLTSALKLAATAPAAMISMKLQQQLYTHYPYSQFMLWARMA